MHWTSRRRSISLHPSKNGGRSNVAQNFKVRVSRFLDTSSTTQVAQISVKHRRPSGSTWTKRVRSPLARILTGRTIRGGSVGTWMVTSSELGISFLFIENKNYSFRVYVDDIKMTGKKHNMAPMWKNLMKLVDLDETNIISWPRIFGMHSTWKLSECNDCWGIYTDVWITYFCWSNWKITRIWKDLTQRRLRGPATLKDMLKNALRDTANWQTKRRSSCTQFQALAWISSIQEGGAWTSWRIIKSMVANCLEMFGLGTKW